MKLILIILLIATNLLAKDYTTRYDVKVGMFGKVGYADVSLNENDSSYEMKLVAKLTGTAASLTGNRVESYISKGKIIDGKYMPDTFTKILKTNSEEEVLTYTFEHKAKRLTLNEKKEEIIKGTKFDAMSFKIISTKEIKKSDTTKVLDKYIDTDILSTYLNTSKSCNTKHLDYDLVAIGARNDRNSITVSLLNELNQENIKDSFSKDVGNIYNLHVEPFDKEKTTVDILLAYDNDGLMKEAILGNVFWIGEIKAVRSYHNVANR